MGDVVVELKVIKPSKKSFKKIRNNLKMRVTSTEY
jgi:hypothetical protein